tara:strand:- start:996 stop:1868 length:873 start_codon:yes stop_codon:yes gene_type:complete
MLTRNEEAFVEQALNSVKGLVDEIIIVDDNSSDKTVEIAKKFTDKVFSRSLDNNFAEARNFTLQKATKDWILILDADEVISSKDHSTIKELIQDSNYVAYSLMQASYTNDSSQFSFTPITNPSKESKGFKGYISCNIIRLFKNHQNIKFANPVHESVDASIQDKNKIKKTNLFIHHYQFEKQDQKEKQLRYLKIYEEKIDLFTNKAKVYRDMGIIYSSFKQEYEKAITCFKKSLEFNENNIKTYVGLVMCYTKLKQFKEALNILEIAGKKFQNNQEIAKIKQAVHYLQSL